MSRQTQGIELKHVSIFSNSGFDLGPQKQSQPQSSLMLIPSLVTVGPGKLQKSCFYIEKQCLDLGRTHMSDPNLLYKLPTNQA